MTVTAVVAGLSGSLTPAAATTPTAPTPAHAVAASATVPRSSNPRKINVLGEWAHPDDDTSIIGPCAVWHQRYGVTCGIIQVTRGEGGGNAVGPETGPALGLRRENEDRAAHYRSGTTSLLYLDKVDFFYNQSAPLTEYVWAHEDTLRRVTRIIRETQPDVYVGFTPTLAAGHGNHQEAGRLIWEGVQAAANPAMFPDQLTGPHKLSTWQVKKVVSGGSNAGTGGSTDTPNCTTGFVPAADNLDTVAGVWTGYDSPYTWPAGNVQGVPSGTPKTWAQVAMEGRLAYPTQSRTMFKQVASPSCSRFGVTDSYVPFQPNLAADGSTNPSAGLDDALLFGAAIPDPGGLPLGTQFYLRFSRHVNVAGEAFIVTVHEQAGARPVPAGRLALTVPDGWKVGRAERIGRVGAHQQASVAFTVTPPASAPAGRYKIAARLVSGAKTGYTDNVMQIAAPVEGRIHRWGKFGEYDHWATTTAPSALRLGRSPAVQSVGVGETITVPVDLHNWSSTRQQGQVSLDLPAGFTADQATKPYPALAPGAKASVSFQVTNVDATLPTSQSYPVTITTSYASPTTSYPTPAGSAGETLSLDLAPQTTIPQAAKAPDLDAKESPGEYAGPALDLSTIWQGAACAPAGVDCGTAPGAHPGDADSTYAKVTWNDDNLYFFVHVRDDTQSYAATPGQCVAHWLTDSVEIQIDPRGNSSAAGLPGVPGSTAADTATTFKTGIFPFTNDPTSTLGNAKANGPCWERDADNHQGYANGPLARTVKDAPNAPGMRVVSSATWDGDNDPSRPHPYRDGYYNLEVKIPMADLPAAVGPTGPGPTGNAAANAVDPGHLGLNITPYDEDNQIHVDQSTRLGWSAWNSVQSDPYRWGHAYLPGYRAPAGRSSTPTAPVIPDSALASADSPQTIWQSAVTGVPFAGEAPAPTDDRLTVRQTGLSGNKATLRLRATGAGRAHIYLWDGDHAYIPVYTSSCVSDPYEPGFTPCAAGDGDSPPWGSDMSGRVVADRELSLRPGDRTVTIPLTAAQAAKLRSGGQAIVSFETPERAVEPTGGGSAQSAASKQRSAQALATPLTCRRVIAGRHRGPLTIASGTTCLTGGTVDGDVTVRRYGSFYATGGSVTGRLLGRGGKNVVVTGTTIGKSVLINDMIGAVSLDQAHVAGSVSLRRNASGERAVVAANTIGRSLRCSGNVPAPRNQRRPNRVYRFETGQCFNF